MTLVFARSLVAPALVLPLLLAGCATPPLPAEGRATGALTTSALRRAHQLYFYPERLDERMLIGALDAVEQTFDAVRFESVPGAAYGVLHVRDARAQVPLEGVSSPAEFEVVLGRALHFVETHLPNEVNRDPATNLELVAVNGALGALDRYSMVFSGQRTDDFRIRFSGKLFGIGSRIGRRDGLLTTVRVFPDSPAAKAGLQDGDGLVRIDGDPTRPLTVEEAVGRIRGPVGTPVVFEVLRGEETLEITVTRGEVRVPSVETKSLGDGIGYAHVTTMSRSTVPEFLDKVAALGDLSGLVLDLRGNTGGSMDSAARLADLFLDEELIYRVVGRNGTTPARGARAMATPRVFVRVPVVVLVGPSTASAAEIVSGAISPLDRVQLVGQKTFGKGVIQRVVPLEPRKAKNLLKLTVGEYILSGDRAIHEKGIEPDIALYPVPAPRLGRLASTPEGALPYVRTPGEADDFPIDFAKALLQRNRDEALAKTRADALASVAEALREKGVEWTDDAAAVPDGDLPQPLVVTIDPLTIRGADPVRVRVHVTNPNDFPIANTWAALDGTVPYLWNQLVGLGTVPAGGEVSGEVEINPGDGLSVHELAIKVHVATRIRPLQSAELRVPVISHAPELEIRVTRVDADNVSIRLFNHGCCGVGQVRVALGGTVRSFDSVPPQQEQIAELPLAGGAERVTVLLQGAGVQQVIEIPIPDDEIVVRPPGLELERGEWLGRSQVRAKATAPDGLAEGWISLDGQKEVYFDWHGRVDGTLTAAIEAGEHQVTTKIETRSGVSLIDSRSFTAD